MSCSVLLLRQSRSNVVGFSVANCRQLAGFGFLSLLCGLAGDTLRLYRFCQRREGVGLVGGLGMKYEDFCLVHNLRLRATRLLSECTRLWPRSTPCGAKWFLPVVRLESMGPISFQPLRVLTLVTAVGRDSRLDVGPRCVRNPIGQGKKAYHKAGAVS